MKWSVLRFIWYRHAGERHAARPRTRRRATVAIMSSSRVVREQSPQPRLIIFPSRAKIGLVAVGALVFVAIGVALILVGEVPTVLAGTASVLFFGVAGAYALRRLAKPTPSVIVDATGVTDNGSAAAAGFLPWHEIVAIRRGSYLGQAMLQIEVADPQAVISRARPWSRPAMRANNRMVGTPVNIPQNVLPMTADQLVGELEAYRPR